jgi:hypothetical protein
MDMVVTEENLPQIVQALFENVKSNQHRLDEVEPVLHGIASDMGELTTLMVKNGYAQAVKDNARELKAFREEFQRFLFAREDTCPTAKRTRERMEERDRQMNKQVAITRLGIAALALIPTLLLIIDRIGG